MQNTHDVVILGGGLAGLTLALQLRRNAPDLSVILLEKRDGNAPTAAHKVGESTVELGTHYLREFLDLGSTSTNTSCPSTACGSFLASADKGNLPSRVELGVQDRAPVPSHQIDRGRTAQPDRTPLRSSGLGPHS